MKKGYLNDIVDELHSLGLVKIAQLLVDWMNIESSQRKKRLRGVMLLLGENIVSYFNHVAIRTLR